MNKNKPTIAAIWFGTGDRGNKYADLASVWEYSAKKVIGDTAEIICLHKPTPDFTQECAVFYRGERKIGPSKTISWMEKINSWLEIIKNTDGPVLLCDIDIAFYKNPFPDVLEFDFDIGICGNNTGAIYFSGTKRSRKFMKRWHEDTVTLFGDAELYQEYDKKFKGLDQASMGYLLETGRHDANVVQLPRRFHSTCHDFELPAYIMHYHSAMRSVVFGESQYKILDKKIHKYARDWKKMLKECRE
jgi:hypothetical protein